MATTSILMCRNQFMGGVLIGTYTVNEQKLGVLVTNRHGITAVEWVAYFTNPMTGGREPLVLKEISSDDSVNVASHVNVNVTGPGNDVMLLFVGSESEFLTHCPVVRDNGDEPPKWTDLGFNTENGKLHITRSSAHLVHFQKRFEETPSSSPTPAARTLLSHPNNTAITPKVSEMHLTPNNRNGIINCDFDVKPKNQAMKGQKPDVGNDGDEILNGDDGNRFHKGSTIQPLLIWNSDKAPVLVTNKLKTDSKSSQDFPGKKNLAIGAASQSPGVNNSVVNQKSKEKPTNLDKDKAKNQKPQPESVFLNDKSLDQKSKSGDEVLGFLRGFDIGWDEKIGKSIVTLAVKKDLANPQELPATIVYDESIHIDFKRLNKKDRDEDIQKLIANFNRRIVEIKGIGEVSSKKIDIKGGVLLIEAQLWVEVKREWDFSRINDYPKMVEQMAKDHNWQCVTYLRFQCGDESIVTIAANKNHHKENGKSMGMSITLNQKETGTFHAELWDCLILHKYLSDTCFDGDVYVSEFHATVDHSGCVSCRKDVASFLARQNPYCLTKQNLELCYHQDVKSLRPTAATAWWDTFSKEHK